jgi:hypothetical protein
MVLAELAHRHRRTDADRDGQEHDLAHEIAKGRVQAGDAEQHQHERRREQPEPVGDERRAHLAAAGLPRMETAVVLQHEQHAVVERDQPEQPRRGEGEPAPPDLHRHEARHPDEQPPDDTAAIGRERPPRGVLLLRCVLGHVRAPG